MSKVIGISGLIGTQDYLVPYKRVSTEALEVTPSWRKTNYNGYDVTDVAVAGVIPVQVTKNGTKADFKYKTISLGTAITTTAEEQTLTASDYAQFDEGVYYSNQSTGEIFYCLSKNADYKVTFKRGLLGTTAAGITTSAVIDVMNTIRLDSATGTETAGVLTLTAGASPMVAGDSFTITIDAVSNTYVMGTDIAVGTSAETQANNIRDALALAYPNWTFANASNNVTGTQKAGYAHPFTIAFTCTSTNAWTGASTTSGVAKTYDTGFGFIIYKEMPRNLPFGQKVYPAYNYNL